MTTIYTSNWKTTAKAKAEFDGSERYEHNGKLYKEGETFASKNPFTGTVERIVYRVKDWDGWKLAVRNVPVAA
ncbi:hypothetical protein Q9V03_000732 [Salmonella enterica]|nr:hypothetical protein [Salmonella enterica]ECO7733833.1 hypothetical protein [Salmonella enterica]EDZ7377388.1 hypothetical protein [Salmonella enterica]EEK5737677.1 hypothetical protein [Salmonella enterica]EEL9952918.1 hypothetical protein [Salmonella enterica]